MKETIFLVPHPDDETLCCGGTIAKMACEGTSEPVIIILTDGSHSHTDELNIFTDPTPLELATIRHHEALLAIGTLGVKPQNIHFARIEDGRLSENIELAFDFVWNILNNRSTEISDIYAPHEHDKHVDHRATATIASRLLNKLAPRPTLYKYIVWQTDTITKINIVNVDISKYLATKKSAMNHYKSQITLLSKTQKKPVLSSIFVSSYIDKHIETFFY